MDVTVSVTVTELFLSCLQGHARIDGQAVAVLLLEHAICHGVAIKARMFARGPHVRSSPLTGLSCLRLVPRGLHFALGARQEHSFWLKVDY